MSKRRKRNQSGNAWCCVRQEVCEVHQVVIQRNLHLQPDTQRDTAKSFNERTPRTFTKQSIKGDANCLFCAVSLCLHNTQDLHHQIREEAVKYIRRNWKELQNHLVTVDPELVIQRTYCYNMRKDKTSGSSVEMLAMSEIYKINFKIFTQVVQEADRNVVNNETPR